MTTTELGSLPCETLAYGGCQKSEPLGRFTIRLMVEMNESQPFCSKSHTKLQIIDANNAYYLLKGEPSEDASWPENLENAQFPLPACFILIVLSIFTQRKYFLNICFKFELLREQPCWFALY